MTGIERHFKEEREARMLLFRQRLIALRDEFADLDLVYVQYLPEHILLEPERGIVEVRKPTRRWSWK